MAANKTVKTDASVDDYLAAVKRLSYVDSGVLAEVAQRSVRGARGGG
jgi:hypothetical protein